ncbi:hypothetical protein BCV69DRAFT_285309 [Microstroma glucosiphilum]|uniref:SUI1 domain-containing protein n=1 Tax=Pseudomicrostroma glucosiphilum TaxID=1684307 RepID=A0A316U0C8_9BASI|nr:hypothetical protein BCV69DRAFT_285309 [Pseudomicrostroma glucosiphilum]PWN18344.1 hypothetical protein BCV69DRAFT_285309 [Pseudomicrostroma glucosiphilum]
MFKRPPQTKPATPLRSSTRRHLLSHLLSLYPVLQHAPPELLAQLLPEGTKQGNALTSNGVKVLIYSEPDVGNKSGRALWFEAGSENGAWMNAGKKSGSGPSKNGKTAATAAVAAPLYEVLPTMYTLWLVPNLLPVLPTWEQVINPALLGGSALMVPGLIPPPNTYATSSAHPDLPRKNALVSIVAHPGNVPQVLARMEMEMVEVIRLREQGGKGKAAVVLHAYKDGLWSLGREEEGMGTLPESVQLLEATQDNGNGDEQGEETLIGAMTAANLNDQDGVPRDDNGTSDQGVSASTVPSPDTFTTSEIDAILYLAFLSAIQDAAASSQDSTLLPMSASAFYSSHVLPHRPSHWPPRPTKGKRAKRNKTTKGPPGSFGGSGSSSVLPGAEEEERQLNTDQVVVGRSSAKKFGKWLKMMEKERGLIKMKESRGETSIVELLVGHQDVQGLTPYQTLAEWQAMQGASGDGDTSGGTVGATAASEASAGTSSSTPGTSLHVEHFYTPSSAGRALFEELGLVTATGGGAGAGAGRGPQDLHTPAVVRKRFTEYMSAHVSPLPKNQAMVLPDETLCGHLELKSASASQSVAGKGAGPRSQPQPQPRKREELHRLFIEQCTVSWHRISRLTPASIEVLSSSSSPSFGSDVSTSSLRLASGEHLGKVVKGAPPQFAPTSSSSTTPSKGGGVITIKIRKRQGNKVVSLLSGLETAYIHPERFAGEVMRQFGTSTSVGPLVGAPSGSARAGVGAGAGGGGGGGLKEVLVQGDLRKGLLEKLERENGVPRGLVMIDEKGK